MPKGPNGQKRPADTVKAAMMVAAIATGEADDTEYKQPQKVEGAKKGGEARAAALSADERSEIAKKANEARASLDAEALLKTLRDAQEKTDDLPPTAGPVEVPGGNEKIIKGPNGFDDRADNRNQT